MGGKKNSGCRKSKKSTTLRADAQQAAFLKNRSKLFKAADELSSLDDAQTAVIFFSPDGKAFSCGNPSANSVINRYLNQHPVTVPEFANTDKGENLRKLRKQYEELVEQLEVEKKRGKMLEQKRLLQGKPNLWEASVEDLNLNELQTLYAMLDGVDKSLAELRAKGLLKDEESSPAAATNPSRND